MKLEASLARNSAASAMSSGWPSRPIGCFGMWCARAAVHVAVTQQPVGLHRAGRERVHPYAARRMIDRHRLGELDQRALRRAVARPPRRSDPAELRRDVDDAAAARAEHRRQHRPAHQVGAGHLHREGPLPGGQRQVEHAAIGIIGRGAVDQNVDRAPGGDRRFGRGQRVGFAADIARDRDPADLVGQRRRRREIHAGDPRACGGECPRDRGTDAAGRAGDHRDLARQRRHDPLRPRYASVTLLSSCNAAHEPSAMIVPPRNT